MARSKPRARISKKGGSCPCIQDKEIMEVDERLTDQEQRFTMTDIYHPNDEFVDLESFSETSSFGPYVDPLETINSSVTNQQIEAQLSPQEIPPGVGDQFEEGTYLSGGNISSGLGAENSESLRSVSFENRKLNILSWLDNYGEARGYRLSGSVNGTSLMLQTDETITSRMDSGGSIDVEETFSGKSRQDIILGPGTLKQQQSLLEKACSTLISFSNDLEPLNKMKRSSVDWRSVQQVLFTWANLMSTIWKRTRDGNVTRSELFNFSRLCENLQVLTMSVSPLDISSFANPIVRLNLGKTQNLFNFALSWTREIQIAASREDVSQSIFSSWSECMKTISMIVNEQMKIVTITYANNLLEDFTHFSTCPKYELILFDDVIPSKTAAGPWMFFGKVELRHIENNNNGESMEENSTAENDQIIHQISLQPRDCGLSIKFWGSMSRKRPCVDYGAIFHIVCRACFETRQYYQNLTKALLKATKCLEEPLIPPSYAKTFGKVSKHQQTFMMNAIFAQIIADQVIDPTITGIDEILRSFDLLIKYTLRSLTRFVRHIKCTSGPDPPDDLPQSLNSKSKCKTNNITEQPQASSPPFKELVIPLETVSSTLFQTIRRFLSLGPMKSVSVTGITEAETEKNTVEGHATSALTFVNKYLESAINTLYEASSPKNIFTFQFGIQTIFAISQLRSGPEFVKKATLDVKMKSLVLYHLRNLKRSNREAYATFKRIVQMIDSQMKKAEKTIDVIMNKATRLGTIDPARTSGVSFSHRHGKFILIRYSRNSYIRRQAKQLRHRNEIHRHTRKYNIEPDYEDSLSDKTYIDR